MCRAMFYLSVAAEVAALLNSTAEAIAFYSKLHDLAQEDKVRCARRGGA